MNDIDVDKFFETYEPGNDPIFIPPPSPTYLPLNTIPEHFSKKDIKAIEPYFTDYDLYVEKIRADFQAILSTQRGYMERDKEAMEIIIEGWIDLHTNEFYKLWKKYQALCVMITAKKKTQAITAETIQKAKEFPIHDIIQFNRSGYRTCIFHSEKTPSMKLNKDNTVHCFGCGKHTDAIGVYMQEHGVDFKEAVIRLAT